MQSDFRAAFCAGSRLHTLHLHVERICPAWRRRIVCLLFATMASPFDDSGAPSFEDFQAAAAAAAAPPQAAVDPRVFRRIELDVARRNSESALEREKYRVAEARRLGADPYEYDDLLPEEETGEQEHEERPISSTARGSQED